jgi:hypothetical protein
MARTAAASQAVSPSDAIVVATVSTSTAFDLSHVAIRQMQVVFDPHIPAKQRGRGDAGSLGFPEGAELREPGEWLARDQLYNSNRTMISSILAGEPWTKVVDYGIVPFSRAALAEVFG